MPRRVALVVGVSQYESTTEFELSPLSSPIIDAQSICDVLGDYGDIEIIPRPFNRNQNGEFYIDQSGYVSADELKRSISEVLTVQAADEIDLAIFYFSGHAILQDEQVVWLAASDKPTAIAFSWLAEQVENSAVKNVCLWLDCCHSGEIFKHIDLKDKGFCVIAASHEQGESIGIRDERSLMTDLLYKALIPGSENGREIRVLDLIRSIETQHKQLKLPQQILTHHGKTSFALTRLDGDVNIDSEYPEGYPPYKGLLTFTDKDQDFFFGRDGMIQQLLDGLNNRQFVPVLGASGSGKSSLVLAGLLPALDKADWLVLEMRPTADPLGRLRDALRDMRLEQSADKNIQVSIPVSADDIQREVEQLTEDDRRLLLVLDQFEEVFTAISPEDEEKRATFLRCLMEALQQTPALHVVVTLRSDFLSVCDEYPVLSKHFQDNFRLGNLDAAGLRQAISRPLALVGMRCEQALEDELVSQTLQEKGSLPLLQFVLQKLWELAREESSRELMLEMYRHLGSEHGNGLRGVLNEKADAFYQRLDAEQQRLMEWLMVELTQVGDGQEDTRRVVALQELYERQPVYREALDELIVLVTKERLLVSDQREDGEATVAVAHEALIRDWDLVAKWLDSNQEIKRWRSRIEADIEDWRNTGGSLLRDGRLAEAQQLLESYTDSLLIGKGEHEIILASERNSRQRKWVRWSTAVSFFGVLLIGLMSTWWQANEADKQRDLAINQKQIADEQRDLAVQQKQIADKQRELAIQRQKEADEQRGLAIQKQQETDEQRKLAIQREQDANYNLAKTFEEKANTYWGAAQRLKRDGLIGSEEYTNNLRHTLLYSLEALKISSSTKQAVLTPATISRLSQIDTRWLSPERKHTPALNLGSNVDSISFSPNGEIFASGSWDGIVRLWDVKSGKLLKKLKGHTGSVSSISFSPDGKTLASGSSASSLFLWDIQTGKILKPLRGHSNPINSIAFSIDGDKLASGSDDNTIRIWDVLSGKSPVTLNNVSKVSSVAFGREGKILASGGGYYNHSIYLWDISNGKLLKKMEGHKNQILSLTFNPDNNMLASGSDGGTIRLWNAQTGKLAQTISAHGYHDVLSVTFSPDGQILASGGSDDAIRLWSAQTGKLLYELRGHNQQVTSLAFSPDSKTLVSGSWDKTIRLWSIESGSSLQKRLNHDHTIHSIAFSSDSKLLASSSRDDEVIHLWNAQTGKLLYELQGHSRNVTSLVFSPNSETLVSGSWDHTLRIWNTQTGELLNTLKNNASGVNSVAFSHDGRVLASGLRYKRIHLWDLESGAIIKTMDGHEGEIHSMAFSLNGKTLFSSAGGGVHLWNTSTGEALRSLQIDDVKSVALSSDGKRLVSLNRSNSMAHLWNASTGELLETLQGHSKEINSVAFSPDNKTLATGSEDKTVRLWSAKNGQLLKTIQGHNDEVTSIAFSSDGKIIASGSRDYTIRLWDAGTKEIAKTLQAHKDAVNSVAVSPTGQIIASGSKDSSISLWDSQTGKLIKKLDDYSSEVTSLDFSPDGNILVSGHRDGTLHLWDAQAEKYSKAIKSRAGGMIRSATFSPDGQIFVSESDGLAIHLWDTNTWERLKSLGNHNTAVKSVAFSYDNRTFASGSHNQTIHIRDAYTGEILKTIQGHGWVRSLAFSPNGKILASGTAASVIQLWDLQSGELIKNFQGHRGIISSLAFSPNGKFIASGSRDKTIRLWNISDQKPQRVIHTSGSVLSLAFTPDGITLVSGLSDSTVQLWKPNNPDPVLSLLDNLDPTEASDALKFIWNLRLDGLKYVSNYPRPALFRHKNYYITWDQHTEKYRPLLDAPRPNETKMDQLIRWLEERCAYKRKEDKQACETEKLN